MSLKLKEQMLFSVNALKDVNAMGSTYKILPNALVVCQLSASVWSAQASISVMAVHPVIAIMSPALPASADAAIS
jgi:hypothetical protein